MAAEFEYRVWGPDVDLSGSPLAVLTIGDQLVDADFHKVLYGTGDAFIDIHGDHPDAQFLQRKAWVQVIRVDTIPEEPKGGFFLEKGDFQALSTKEQKGRILRFSGPGGLSIFERYNLDYSVYAPGQTHRGDIDVPDKWFWSQEPYGAMLVRLIEEGKHHPQAPYEPIAYGFTRTRDTNNLLWDELADYETSIGTNGLKLLKDFMQLGLVVQCSADMLVTAYRDVDDMATDRTSATFASGKVRFEAGVNIANNLPKRIDPLSAKTYVLIRDRTGDYQTVDEDLDGNPIPGPAAGDFISSSTTADDDAIIKMGKIRLTRRLLQSDSCRIIHRIGPGGASGADGYNPGEDYDVGDLVTVHTGTGDHDYDEQPLQVAGWRVFVRGADWLCEVELGGQAISDEQAAFQSQIQTTIREIGGTALCQPDAAIETEGAGPERLYFTAHEAGGSPNASQGEDAPTPGISSEWDQDEAIQNHFMLNAAYQNSWSSTNWSDTDNPAPRNVFLGSFLYELSGDLLAMIQSGGAVVRGQLRGRARYGIGISEGAQDHIAQIGIRVVTSSGGVVGTALNLDDPATSAGSTKMPAQATLVNRVFPPAAASTNVLDPVPSAATGDYLVVEVGVRHFGPVTGGTGAALEAGGASDLGENETDTAGRGWIEFEVPAGSVTVTGDGMAELVGTSNKAKRCDDTETYHAVGSASPTVDDDRDAGFRLHTRWVNDDGEEWVCFDTTPGAAEWVQLVGTGGGGGGGGLTIESELRHSTTQACTSGTHTAVTWDTEISDAGAMHAGGAPTRITVGAAQAGKVIRVVAQITLTSAAATQWHGYIRKNGTTELNKRVRQISSTSGLTTLQIDQSFAGLVATDYLEVMVLQSSGSSRDIGSATADANNFLQVISG